MTPARRAFLGIPLALLFAPRTALAHAILLRSNPQHDSTIHPGAMAVALVFNSRIDRSRSRLTLTAPGGRSTVIAIRDDSTDAELRADASVDRPGAWKLRWQVLAADGHITRGDVAFTVTAS